MVCRSHSFFFFGIQVSARVGTNKVVLSVVMKKKEHIIEESEESNKRDQQQPPGPRRLTAPAPARLLHRHRHWLRHRNRYRHRHRPRPVLGPGGPPPVARSQPRDLGPGLRSPPLPPPPPVAAPTNTAVGTGPVLPGSSPGQAGGSASKCDLGVRRRAKSGAHKRSSRSVT